MAAAAINLSIGLRTCKLSWPLHCWTAQRPCRSSSLVPSQTPSSCWPAPPSLPARLISDPGYAGHSFNLFAGGCCLSAPPLSHVAHGLTNAPGVVGRSRRGATGSQKCEFLPSFRRPQVKHCGSPGQNRGEVGGGLFSDKGGQNKLLGFPINHRWPDADMVSETSWRLWRSLHYYIATISLHVNSSIILHLILILCLLVINRSHFNSLMPADLRGHCLLVDPFAKTATRASWPLLEWKYADAS